MNALSTSSLLEHTISEVTAAHLGIDVRDLDPATPLTRFGLDSLGAVELTAAIEDATGLELPPDLLAQTCDLRSLYAALGNVTERCDDELDLMRADAMLPDEVCPQRAQNRFHPVSSASLLDASCILLTGATGFVGGALLRVLLDRTDATIICLVRSRQERAGDRLARVARSDRVELLEGDLDRPSLGLSHAVFTSTAKRIDAICHAGAIVNWVLGYRALRGANVIGTRELLRLASSADPVPFHFVSSLSVCYASSAPRRIDERFDPLPHLAALRFGYAQSKAVAEALVRQAGTRGLPVHIYRPALASGNSRSGAFNPDDLLSRLVAGCIRMGTAPDLDWRLDAVPVDILADAIVRMSVSSGRTLHITHPRPRHWRECVLWMRVYGYPLELIPYRDWVAQLERETVANDPLHPLAPLRSFFLRIPIGERLTIPELHQESRRPAARAARTEHLFRRAGGVHVPLDASLLRRYFDAFVAAEYVPPASSPIVRLESCEGLGAKEWRTAFVERLVRRHLPGTEVLSVVERGTGSDDSIVAELTSWRSPRPTGLFRYRIRLSDSRGVRNRDVILKLKASDEDTLVVGEALARLLDDRVGAAYTRWQRHLGIVSAREREIALYRQNDPRFTRHVPEVLGIADGDDDGHTWAVVLEEVPHVAAKATRRWTQPDIDAAVRGLAALHSIWFARETELSCAPWIGLVRTPALLAEMHDLWRALADHNAPVFTSWAGRDLRGVQNRLIDTLPDWTSLGSGVPRTLIHHDFNPRNVCLRASRPDRRLCAFDWELATPGAPQRDLAELLCFTVGEQVTKAEVYAFLELHRRMLAVESGCRIDATAWEDGFRAALYEFMLDRLALYALVHRVKRQAFLPTVVSTWFALYRHFPLRTS